MPQAQWVLDAAYTPDSGQAASNGVLSPQRPRRGPGVLHLDCRGLTTGAASKSPATSHQTAQWKPASTYKALSNPDGNALGAQQTHPALLLSVLAGQSAHGPNANTALRNSAVGASSGLQAPSVHSARPQPPGPVDASSLNRAQRQQVPQVNPSGRSSPGAFSSSRVGTISAAAAAAAVAAPRPYTYNPLLPRQASAGRRRPATEPRNQDSPQPSSGSGAAVMSTNAVGPGGASPHPTAGGAGGSSSGGSRGGAATSTAVFAPTLLQPSSNLNAEFLLRRIGSSGSTAGSGAPPPPPPLLAQGQHYSGLTVASYASHGASAEEIAAAANAAAVAAAAAVRLASGPGAVANGSRMAPTHPHSHTTEQQQPFCSIPNNGSGAGSGTTGASMNAAGGAAAHGRTRFDSAGGFSDVPVSAAAVHGGGSEGSDSDARRLSPGLEVRQSTHAAAGGGIRREHDPSPLGPSSHKEVGGGSSSGHVHRSVASQRPPSSRQQEGREQGVRGPACNPGVGSQANSIGRSSAGSGGADDSAFEYFGTYEADAASGEDEGGGEDEEEEDGGEEEEEEAGEGGSGGEEEAAGEVRKRHSAPALPIRAITAAAVSTTQSAGPRRMAAAAAPPAATASALRTSIGAAALGGSGGGGTHIMRALSSRSLSRQPSSGSGRPPPPPAPPASPQPQTLHLTLQRPQTRRTPMATAGLSGCTRDGSGAVSETSGSRPGTALSVWSAYDLLQPDPRAPISIRSLPNNGMCNSAGGANVIVCNSSPNAGITGFGLRGLRLSGPAPSHLEGSSGGRRRVLSNARENEVTVAVVEARDSDGSGGGAAAASAGRSRCSSPASSRCSGDGAAAHAMVLLASLGLTSPPSPSGASVGTRRRRAPPPSRGGGGGRKAASSGGGGGSLPPTPTRPLHPAVLALSDHLPMMPASAAGNFSHPPSTPIAAPTELSAQQQQLLATASIPTDAKGRPFPYVLQPAYPGTCPTIAFIGSAAAKQAAGLTPLLAPTLIVKYGGVANTPVRTAFREAGLRPTRKGKRWIVQWGGILDAASLAKLHCFQRVNHFPGTWELGHKGHLYRNVYNARRRARGPAAEAFDIVPRFYIMPRDYEEFRSDCERFPDRLYIQKPTNSSRGRGIRMVTRPDAISRDCKDVLVQHYIANPLLLNGFKFDMRVYAAATCLDPLRLYVFPDGLARLATEPYSADRADLSKRCVHLTNYSVNKKSAKFVRQTAVPPPPGTPQPTQQGSGEDGISASSSGAGGSGSAAAAAAAGGKGGSANGGGAGAGAAAGGGGGAASECQGSKWSLSGLKAFLEARGMGPGWAVVWRQVCDIVAAAVIAAEPRMNTEFKMKVPHRNNCFEVWGFDIMLTDVFRAWLIEANTCPSLAADSGLDMRVKCTMVSEVLHLLGVVPYDVDVYEKTAEAKRQSRLTGLPVASPAAATPAGGGGGGGGLSSSSALSASASRGGAGGGAGGGGGGSVEEEPSTPTTPSGGLGAQHSFGTSGGAAGGVGGVYASGGGAVQVQPRTLQELEGVDFTSLSPGELPDIVLEAEAEMARRGSWQRVFPCEEDPGRYLNLFETPRLNNVLLCKYYAQTSGIRAGSGSEATEALRKRPVGSARLGRGGGAGGSGGGGAGGSRPVSREWRPGGAS